MKKLISLFYRSDSKNNMLYMLQAVDYNPRQFLSWWVSEKDFRLRSKRKKLVLTTKIKLLMAYIALIVTSVFVIGVNLLARGDYFGLIIIALYPLIETFSTVIIVAIAWPLLVKPKQKAFIAKSKQIFASHRGPIIAVLGSYGKKNEGAFSKNSFISIRCSIYTR